MSAVIDVLEKDCLHMITKFYLLIIVHRIRQENI